MTCCSDAGSSRSASAVKPLTPANITVAVLRARVVDEPAAASRMPHAEQNAASSGPARPHAGHAGMARV